MMKRILVSLLAAVLLMSAVCIVPVTAVTSGVLEYNLDADGNAKITRCNATTSNYTIPSTVDGHPVTALAKGFILNNTVVRTLTIPASVTFIEFQCFRDHCPATVIFEAGSNPTMDGSVFYLGTGLTKLVIAEGMEHLCRQLCRTTSVAVVTLPSTLKSIDEESFYGCSKLTELSIPAAVEEIGDRAFYSATGLRSHIVLSENCTRIGAQAFLNCTSLTKVSILNKDCIIAGNAFDQCSSVTIYGRKNSTAYALCQAKNNLHFVCATDEDHVFPETWDTIVEPTDYRFGLALQSCEICGQSRRKVLPKTIIDPPKPPTPPTPPEENEYVSGEDFVNVFDDVDDGAWYRDAVGFAVANGIFNGTSKTSFSPDTAMTRGMFVTVLWRIEKEPAAGTAEFTDVPSTRYDATAIAWASETGVAGGVGENLFAPDATLSREQLATMLFRYLEKKGTDVSARADMSVFADGSEISDFAADAMSYATKTGLLQGSNNKVSPNGSATRAQCATILYRMLWKK